MTLPLKVSQRNAANAQEEATSEKLSEETISQVLVGKKILMAENGN
ncbi:MAG: hypothetical protein K5678_12075 [Acetatifactor sp.]|nr:hypothetical protein [Acetatifactor sp.]